MTIPCRALILAVLLALPGPALAISSHCIALAGAGPGIRQAGLIGPDLAKDEVRLHYAGHSTYLIETADGQLAATDYTGLAGPGVLPDLVTMNNAHGSHFTDFPDPAITHVLKGWGGAEPAFHAVELGEMLVRNVTTDIRASFGAVPDGNSIFIFEVAGLCIGHLGHLHHEPSDEQYARIGRLDVVMVPVDGGRTLDTASMLRVMDRLKAQVVLPMHWFGTGTLASFLDGLSEVYTVQVREESALELSLASLPREKTVIVLLPAPAQPSATLPGLEAD